MENEKYMDILRDQFQIHAVQDNFDSSKLAGLILELCNPAFKVNTENLVLKCVGVCVCVP